jgi:hypothetical protein
MLGSLLLLGRLAHAYGFARTPQIISLRKSSMYLTFAGLLLASVSYLALAFWARQKKRCVSALFLLRLSAAFIRSPLPKEAGVAQG